MATSGLDQLFWTSHQSIHSKLNGSIGRDGQSALDEHFPWLLASLARFQASNEAAKKHITEKVKLDIKGKAFKYEAKHRPIVLRAAQLLVRHADGTAGATMLQ